MLGPKRKEINGWVLIKRELTKEIPVMIRHSHELFTIAIGIRPSDSGKERRYGFLPTVESLWGNRFTKPIVIMSMD